MSSNDMNITTVGSLIPKKIDEYTPFGHHYHVKTIISSKKFCPAFITGLSGCGKTTTVEQVCCELKRECIRVNFTPETDEDDLFGGFRLENGNTNFKRGPVPLAMSRGAVLLLDEVDLASSKVMCLQPVLEGGVLLLKKTGDVIHPAHGFTIFATANTKGQGDDSGKFIGTGLLNEAFLDRYRVTYEQDWPDNETEVKILKKIMKSNGSPDDEFASILVNWADKIRKRYAAGDSSDVISTRRLIHIVEIFSIFKDRAEAIESCVSRMSDETKTQFKDSYMMLDKNVDFKIKRKKFATNDEVDCVEVEPGKCPIS